MPVCVQERGSVYCVSVGWGCLPLSRSDAVCYASLCGQGLAS